MLFRVLKVDSYMLFEQVAHLINIYFQSFIQMFTSIAFNLRKGTQNSLNNRWSYGLGIYKSKFVQIFLKTIIEII